MQLNVDEMTIILKLSNLKFKEDPNMTEFSDALGIRQDHSHFRKIKKWLEENNIIKVYTNRGNKIISIDFDRLDEEIPEIEYNKLYEQLFRYKYPRGFIFRK